MLRFVIYVTAISFALRGATNQFVGLTLHWVVGGRKMNKFCLSFPYNLSAMLPVSKRNYGYLCINRKQMT